MARVRIGRLLALAPSAALVMLAAGLLLATWPGRPPRSIAAPPADQKPIDPAAWGTDHVGQGIPDYMDSGECLFCHRAEVGVTWQRNKHNLTIREPEADSPALAALRANGPTAPLAGQVEMLLGGTRAQRFLKRSQAYGKADMLGAVATFGRGRRAKLEHADDPKWATEKFATHCAGCHTTAVNPETHAFSALAIDCFSCHGDATAEHANDPKLMPLAKARKDSPEVVTSICASCHVRSGKSKSSGLPYPTNFVAGDNLFKDFQVAFDRADDASLNPADRHVLTNVRDVVVHGRQTMTCLSCHDVHAGSSKRHRDLPAEAICAQCHDDARPIQGNKTYEVHSDRCEY